MIIRRDETLSRNLQIEVGRKINNENETIILLGTIYLLNNKIVRLRQRIISKSE